MKLVIKLGLAAAIVLASTVAFAQVYLPTAPGLCIEPDWYDGRPDPESILFWGYNAHGYIDGLLVHVTHESRYSGDWPDEDEDWNFILRPIDSKTCPDGQQMMGRDCKRARELYIDLVWGNSQWEWRAGLIDVLKAHRDFAGLTAQEKNLLMNSSGENHTFAAEHVERKLWASIVLDPDRFNSFYWSGGNVYTASHWVLEGEVSISAMSGDDEFEDPSFQKLLGFANLQHECSDRPDDTYPHGCDIKEALFYGTITTDLNHDEGKLEMHPIRAIVSNDDRADLFGKEVFASANPPITTTVRAFADYGKAGDNGSGSVAGRICEHWLQNTFNPDHNLPVFPPYASLNGGQYRSYVTITPDAFEFPRVSSPAGGKIPIIERVCAVRPLIGIPLQGTSGGLGVSVDHGVFKERCPGFAADPAYIGDDDNMQRLFGGWWVSEFVTRNRFEGSLALTAKLKSEKPIPLGVLTAGTEFEGTNGVKVPRTARYWKVVAEAEAKVESGSNEKPMPINKLEAFRWEVSVNVVKAPVGNGVVNLYIPVAPAKNKDLDHYQVAAVAVGRYENRPLLSNKLAFSIPRPRVSARATYAFDVNTASDGTKSIVYKPSFHAKGIGFIAGAAAFTWMKGNSTLGQGADITLSLTEADADARIRLRGADTADGGPYEVASSAVTPYIPEVQVAAPDQLQKKGGTSVTSTIRKVGATAIKCAGATALPAQGYSQVTLVAAMKVPKNPYQVPEPTKPEYTWGTVQIQSGDTWSKFTGTKISGAGNDTLSVTIDDLKSTDDLTELAQFRVRLSVVDAYGRRASTLVHFTNWDASDVVKAIDQCFDDSIQRLSEIPKYDWGKSGIKDPLRDPQDATRDKDLPLRDPVLLSRLNMLYDSQGAGKLLARSVAPNAAPSRTSSKKRTLGGTAIFNGIEKAKQIAPALQ